MFLTKEQRNKGTKVFSSLLALVLAAMMVWSCTKGGEDTKKTSFSSERKIVSKNTTSYPISKFVKLEIKESPFTVIFSTDELNNHIWIVQGEKNFRDESIDTINRGNLAFFKEGFLKLSYDGREDVYSLKSDLHKNNPLNAVGISKIIDDNLLKSLRGYKVGGRVNVGDQISEKAKCNRNGSSANSCKCSGGPGSVQCECGGSIAGVSWHEGITCAEGFYACCEGL